MNRRLLSALLLAAGAIAALSVAPAQAKGPAEGRLCGSSGCQRLRGWERMHPFTSWWDTPFAERKAPPPAPFFRLVVQQAAPDAGRKITWTLLYAPSRSAMRITQNRVPPYHTGIGPYWRAVPATARIGLRRAVAGLDPFPASSTWQAGR